MKQKELISIIFVMAGTFLLGTTGTAQHFSPEQTSPLTIGAIRLAIGGTVLLIFALIKGSLKGTNLFFNKNSYLAAVAMASFQLFFFAAVLKTGVATGSVIAIGSSPLFAGLLTMIINKELPEKRWLIATFVSILGCSLLVGGTANLVSNPMGILLALAAGFAAAMQPTAAKPLLQQYPVSAVTGSIFFISALMLAPILFIFDVSWIFTIRGTIVALHLGLLTCALAFTLYFHGLKNLKVNTAVTIALVEPTTASLLGIFLLKEDLTIISLIGIILVLGGLLILATNPSQTEKVS